MVVCCWWIAILFLLMVAICCGLEVAGTLECYGSPAWVWGVSGVVCGSWVWGVSFVLKVRVITGYDTYLQFLS